LLLHTRKPGILFTQSLHKRREKWLILFVFFSLPTRASATFKDTTKRADAATAEAEKIGAKNHAGIWTMGAYDVILLL